MAVTFADERHYLDYEGLNQFMDKLNKNFRTRFKYKGELYIASETRTNWDDLIPAAVGNLYVLKADELVPDPDHPGEFLPPSPTSITIDGVDYEVGDTIYVTNRVQDALDPADPDAVHVKVNKITGNSKGIILVDELPAVAEAKEGVGYFVKKLYKNNDGKFIDSGIYCVDKDADGNKSWINVSEPRERAACSVSKLEDYLYSVYYDHVDWKDAFEYTDVADHGACSAGAINRYMVRNYDWTYDEGVDFVVSTPAYGTIPAIIGMTAAIPSLTKDVVESGVADPAYKIVPFRLLDGMNSYGVAMAILVVPFDPDVNVPTTNTNGPVEDAISASYAIRYILERAKTASEAAFIFDTTNWYVSQRTRDLGFEVHFLVHDNSPQYESSYHLYFEDNGTRVSLVGMNSQNYTSMYFEDQAVLSNFRTPGSMLDEENRYWTLEEYSINGELPSSHGFEKYSSGIERYNAMRQLICKIGQGIINPIENLWVNDYFNTRFAYGLYSNRTNLSDAVGTHGLTIDSPINDFKTVVDTMHDNFDPNDRDGIHWHTVHTVVYDVLTGDIKVISAELPSGGEEYSFKANINQKCLEYADYSDTMFYEKHDIPINKAYYSLEGNALVGTDTWERRAAINSFYEMEARDYDIDDSFFAENIYVPGLTYLLRESND